MKKKIFAALLAFTMVFAFTACGGGSSDGGDGGESAEAIHLSLGHTNNTEHHYQQLSENFAQLVSEKTGGSIVIDIYPAEQLGSGQEQMEYVKSGTQDMCLNPDAYMANYDPMFNAIEMPFAITSWDQVRNLPGSEAAKTLEAAAEAQGIKILGWSANGMRVFSTTKEVNSPADLSGLKIRCGSAELINAMITALNAQPTTLSMSDIYNGVQTGICDGQENPTANIMGFKLYEVTPYIAVTHHQYCAEPLYMNLDKFNSLSEEQQQALLEAAAEACAADVEVVASGEEGDLKAMEEEYGCTITYPDQAAFEEVFAPVTQSFYDKYGADFQALCEQIKAL
ncbi:MAG: TRAP transporter substrate-binding protein [Mogibacterium sp.]|nr:TRAP transporter substrate-binding protein [Mogibacterium sp.]